MARFLTIFLICFALAFGGGYLFFSRDKAPDVATEETTKTDDEVKEDSIEMQQGDNDANEGRALVQTGCISCHSVSNLNLQGATGPDLSDSYTTTEGKHGVPIEEFLRNPTSAVMSSVISGDPLTDDELESIVAALKVAAEK